MTVGAGELVYRLGTAPCSGVGLRWSDNELSVAMDGQVAAVLFDDEGKANIDDIFAGVPETGFVQDGLSRVLGDPNEVEDWRVGEAIAEAYLTDHRSCSFPWPDGRDERKSGSSLPGADLVGFGIDDDGDCLAFGEVKTSSQHRYPPGAMYGRTGFETATGRFARRRSHPRRSREISRSPGGSAPWRAQFQRAASRYLRNTSDVQLYGCLVRDVEPDQDDLRVRVGALGTACPEGTRIELLALYLPQERLAGIGEEMISRRAGAER